MIILKKLNSYFLKRVIYGYRKLKRNNNLELFCLLNNDLTIFEFNIKKNSIFFFGNHNKKFELSIRQCLLKELAGYRLQKACADFLPREN